MAAATLMVTTLNAQEVKVLADSVAQSQTVAVEQAAVAAMATDVAVDAAPVAEVEKPTRFLPMRQRINRNVDKNKMVYRGEFMLGLAASYGKLDAADADFMLFIDDINMGVSRLSVKPSFAYAYRDNRAIGVRVGYEKLQGNLDNISLNLGSIAEGLGLSNLGVYSESLSCAIFHRNYMAFDRRGIVGAILDTELKVKSGTMSILSGVGEDVNEYTGNNFSAKFCLSPGLAVYVFPQVCVSVTVGIGGLYYNYVRQYDSAGIETGRRDASGLQFKFNLADIQFGVVVHLWNKKKS